MERSTVVGHRKGARIEVSAIGCVWVHGEVVFVGFIYSEIFLYNEFLMKFYLLRCRMQISILMHSTTPTTHHHHITHAPTHARPSLPIVPNPNPVAGNL